MKVHEGTCLLYILFCKRMVADARAPKRIARHLPRAQAAVAREVERGQRGDGAAERVATSEYLHFAALRSVGDCSRYAIKHCAAHRAAMPACKEASMDTRPPAAATALGWVRHLEELHAGTQTLVGAMCPGSLAIGCPLTQLAK